MPMIESASLAIQKDFALDFVGKASTRQVNDPGKVEITCCTGEPTLTVSHGAVAAKDPCDQIEQTGIIQGQRAMFGRITTTPT